MSPAVQTLSRRVADLGTTIRTLQAELESGDLAESESLRRVIRAAKHLHERARADLAAAVRAAHSTFPDDELTVVDATPYQETSP